MIGGIHNRLIYIYKRTFIVHNSQWHELALVTSPRNANAVVGDCRSNSRHIGSVLVAVATVRNLRIVVVGGKIPALVVVNKAVVIVVNAIGNIVIVNLYVALKVGMCKSSSCIGNTNHNGSVALADVPSLVRTHIPCPILICTVGICIFGTGKRVIGNIKQRNTIQRFRIFNFATLAKIRNCLIYIHIATKHKTVDCSNVNQTATIVVELLFGTHSIRKLKFIVKITESCPKTSHFFRLEKRFRSIWMQLHNYGITFIINLLRH